MTVVERCQQWWSGALQCDEFMMAMPVIEMVSEGEFWL